MRATDLLGADVVEDEQKLGVVADVRLVAGENGVEVVALLVGPRKPVRLLGPREAERSGPWIVDRLLRIRDRKILCIPWSDVVQVDRSSIRVHRSETR